MRRRKYPIVDLVDLAYYFFSKDRERTGKLRKTKLYYKMVLAEKLDHEIQYLEREVFQGAYRYRRTE